MNDISPASVIVSTGRPHRPGHPLNAPIEPGSALVPGGAAEYQRHGAPAWDPFEEILGALEGGQAIAFASGIAASAAVFSLVPDGSVVVAPRHGYNGTTHQLSGRNVEVRLVDPSNTEETLAALDGAVLLWLESPTNPAMEVADLATLLGAAKEAGILSAVDNTVATPLRQRPLDLGADLVVHSVSKYLSGHSDVVLGAVVAADPAHAARLRDHRSIQGAIPGTLEIWLATRGVRTLHVRLDRAEANARILHERLSAHPKVAESRYPGFGGLLSLVIDDADEAQAVTERTQLVVLATSLGGVETTWERRHRHGAEPDSIPTGLIRLSVGIEDVDDLWADIAQALG